MKNYVLAAIFSLFACSLSAQEACFNYNKAIAQYQYQNYDGAVKLFTMAISEKPDLADAYANRGVAYHKLNQLDKAIADYLKDLSLKKDRSNYNLACAYAMQNKKDEAFRYLELTQKSEFRHIAKTFEEEKELDPRWKVLLAKDVFTPCDKAMIEVNEKYDAKDYEGSLKACDKAIAADKMDKRAYVSKGYIYCQLGKFEASLVEYDKLLKIDPNDSEGYAGKANVYFQQRNYVEAIPLYEIATLKNPCFLPYYETGLSKYATGKKESGISDIKKSCEIYPNDDFLVYTCGKLLYDMEKEDEALVYAEKALILNRETPEYFLLRAYVYQVKKKWESAISDYSKVVEMNSRGKGEAYYKRGICKANRFAETREAVDKKGFCADMESAEALGITEAAQYLRELCD